MYTWLKLKILFFPNCPTRFLNLFPNFSGWLSYFNLLFGHTFNAILWLFKLYVGW